MQQRFLLQVLLLAQHVSGTTMPSSGAEEYYIVVAACGILCCGFQVAGLQATSCKPDT